jgi:phage tail sheath protein FI
MPVTTSYPGIYIEELPSNAHSVTAAPTSIAVFVGYTHPFKTLKFGEVVPIFNFTDFERAFGGLFVSSVVDSSVAYSVQEFFFNGGSSAYVIGLNPAYWTAAGKDKYVSDPAVAPTASAGTGTNKIKLTGLELTDRIPMLVSITNVSGKVGDIVVSYGSRLETYRGVSVDPASPRFIELVLGTAANRQSGLVTVSPDATYPTTMPSADQLPLQANPPAGIITTFSASDFEPIFDADGSLDKLAIFNLLLIPGVADNAIWSAALAFAERKRAFVILDPPQDAKADDTGDPALPTIASVMDNVVPKSPNGAIYFPYVLTTDPLSGKPIELPPSGYVAGTYSKTDLNRGVWKAPAGLETSLLGTTGVVPRGRMTDMRQGLLNPKGINCLRSFPAEGTVVFGARTLVAANPAFEQWRYVPVRRMALFIEQSLYASLTWAIFEPNDEPLWAALRTTVNDFMITLFNQHAFEGSTPSQAFLVKCDSSTTTQYDIDQGVVNIIVGFRPLKPAEFVVIKIAQLAGQAQS